MAFQRIIRPILSDNCFACHGPDAERREAGLRLDIEDDAKADLGGYAVIVPGKPDSSELVRRIRAEDESERMPPPDSGKQLTPRQISLLEAWIGQGAKWEAHWAYVRPTALEHASMAGDKWSANWIDRCLQREWRARGLQPADDAEPPTLVRRLHFDLLGLPPDPHVVDRFVQSPTSEAYETLVDSLLSSPHFGERMAVYWLDLVRYADTVGYHGDQDHNISPYRDYVIDAFNRNMPFDQFTREQLAGDLLPDPTVDQRVASGYNRLLQTSHEGGVQPKEYLTIYAADRVRNLSEVWLGGTLGCAQCHDHKYDPYTTRDFYSMAAFFADIDEAQHFTVGTNALPTKRPPEIMVLSRGERQTDAALAEQIRQLQEAQEQASLS
ncbi:MAG: DUF1549 domain-containing protein, partial [Planctomycetaceae bacterium]|nr:DUF1549 domain-containing protein [Planctomycetaceae bacterium]